MFKEDLEDRFKKIFKIQKVTFDQPGESLEQHCMFVNVEVANSTFKDGRVVGRAEGTVVVFGGSDQIPFGFFAKAVNDADPELIAPLFFFDFEENTRRYRDIVQRSFSFVYFYDQQYDPDTGSITSVTFTIGGP